MLVTLHPPAIAGAAMLAALALATSTSAASADTEVNAGPVQMRITPCLIANRSHQGPPCEEPQVDNAGSASERSARHLARARFFIDMQDVPKAAGETDAALALSPSDLAALHLSARLALTMGNMERARSDIAKALKQAPDDPDLLATRAALAEPLGPLEAMHEFEAVIARYPDHIYSRAQHARILLDYRRPAEALVDLDFLTGGDKPEADFFALRGRALLQLGRPQAATADFSRAIEINPRLDYLTSRAEAYVRSGADEAALRDYDAILGPIGGPPAYAIGGGEYGEYLMQRALILVRARRFDDAAADMTTAILGGGKSSVLRAQVFLRRNGFPDIALDGRDSTELRKALSACFGLNACFQGLIQNI